jgi:hypothetical protein
MRCVTAGYVFLRVVPLRAEDSEEDPEPVGVFGEDQVDEDEGQLDLEEHQVAHVCHERQREAQTEQREERDRLEQDEQVAHDEREPHVLHDEDYLRELRDYAAVRLVQLYTCGVLADLQ